VQLHSPDRVAGSGSPALRRRDRGRTRASFRLAVVARVNARDLDQRGGETGGLRLKTPNIARARPTAVRWPPTRSATRSTLATRSSRSATSRRASNVVVGANGPVPLGSGAARPHVQPSASVRGVFGLQRKRRFLRTSPAWHLGWIDTKGEFDIQLTAAHPRLVELVHRRPVIGPRLTYKGPDIHFTSTSGERGVAPVGFTSRASARRHVSTKYNPSPGREAITSTVIGDRHRPHQDRSSRSRRTRLQTSEDPAPAAETPRPARGPIPARRPVTT